VAAKAERSRCNFSSIPARIVTQTLGLGIRQLYSNVHSFHLQHNMIARA
jgi:hypothetical protein